MPQSVVQVDAFTDKPFSGNPAAVCVMEGPADEVWMQTVAREMNLSETAFLYPLDEGYHLRWFTPKVEVNLCGHATLASAHVLFESELVPDSKSISFKTRSGLLTACRDGEFIELNFPATHVEESSMPPGLTQLLGVRPKFVGRSAFDYLVEVESEAVVRALKPDFSELAKLPVRGLCVTAFDFSKRYDFVSRFFAPAAGVNEDPVTGSAHCALAPYWAKYLHRNEFLAYQASPRGGEVRLRLEDDRVILGGKAITVMRGELTSDRVPEAKAPRPTV